MPGTPRLVRYWDRQAGTYDRRTAWAERRLLATSRPWVCGRARGETLEIAVGTGANLVHYAADVELTGIDWSERMLEEARAEASRVGRPLRLRRADATDLPFADATFDSVVGTFSMCCIPDVDRALTEAVRVLRPGGRLLLADHVASSSWWLRALQRTVDLATVPLEGEHYTRRPVENLRRLGVTIEETERHSRGVIERVHARVG